MKAFERGRFKVKVKVHSVEQGDGYYKVRYHYTDLRSNNPVLYGVKYPNAIDELDAFRQFKNLMDEVNYEVVTNE
jgi:hypothetical protein